MRTVFIGYTEEEEAELRRADEQADEQEQYIPGIPPMPKIHIKHDNDQETEKEGCKIRYRNSDGTIHAKE